MQFPDLLNDQNNFKIEHMTYHGSVSMASSHYHSHYEILYIENGNRTICINETKNIELNQNNIALIPPNIIHSTKSNSESQSRFLINISTDLMDKIVEFSSPYITSGFDTMILDLTMYDLKLIKYYLHQLTEIQDNPSPFKDESIKIILSSLLLQLTNVNYNILSKNDFSEAYLNYSSNIENIIKYISTYYYEDITLDQLANKANMSKQHFIRVFTEKYQTTPIKFLNTFRIITAKRLLESNTMNVTDVLKSCGFNSSAHFSRTFKQTTGITPKEYQLKCKNSQK